MPDNSIVSKFKEFFPMELPSMLPDRDINFYTDLEVDNHPISIVPYRMVPNKLKELKV